MARDAVVTLANAVNGIFRQQRAQARGGKVRFGDYNSRLAAKLLGPLSELYLRAAKKAGPEFAPSLASAAKARAQQTAALINDVTTEWLEEGRELDSVFGVDRAVAIAMTEESQARNQGVAMMTMKRGGKLQWVTKGKSCDACKGLNGKVVNAGQQFITKSAAYYHPPAHPNCRCALKVVK